MIFIRAIKLNVNISHSSDKYLAFNHFYSVKFDSFIVENRTFKIKV